MVYDKFYYLVASSIDIASNLKYALLHLMAISWY